MTQPTLVKTDHNMGSEEPLTYVVYLIQLAFGINYLAWFMGIGGAIWEGSAVAPQAKPLGIGESPNRACLPCFD